MAVLSNTTVLGLGRVYQFLGQWLGNALPPSPSALNVKFGARRFVAYSYEMGDRPWMTGYVTPDRDGLTVADAMRVMGYAGATGGCAMESDAISATQLRALPTGESVGEFANTAMETVQEAAESATEIGGIAVWLVRNWPIALLVGLGVWAVATGKLRIA